MHTELIPVPLFLPDLGIPRSEGIHVSGVIRAIAIENGILKPEWCESLALVDLSQQDWWTGISQPNKLRIMMGIAWEEYYAKVMAEQMGVVFHPGEFCVDGIYMTPDGESLDIVAHMTGLAMHEFKLTYKSTKTVSDLETQWMWIAQARAYCKARDTRVCYMHVLFTCGDYSYPISPLMKCWRVVFSQAELDENWDILTSYVEHRRRMDAEDQWKDTL